MIGLTHTTGYAVQLLCSLGSNGCQWRRVRDLARGSGIQRPYVAKIVNRLTRAGLLLSKRGYRGGVVLARPASRVSLMDVVQAVEGKAWIEACLLGMDTCAAIRFCPTRDMWAKVRQQIEAVLRKTTLADLCRRRRTNGRKVKERGERPIARARSSNRKRRSQSPLSASP